MNIYAFPLPGDPVIRPETRDEMIDRMAREALAEIRGMADAAREKFAEPETQEVRHPLMNDPAGWQTAMIRGRHGLLAQQSALGSPAYLTGLDRPFL